MEQQELIPHLFRTEFSKITAVLCKLFGLANVDIAEDIASETFLAALETWPFKGIPENATGWLYTVAKNKARNLLARDHLFQQRVLPQITTGPYLADEIDIDLSAKHIADSQLQLLFAICHPCISNEAQVGLSLRILCGFGIDEIATAFLASKDTINKRLFRAKEKLRAERIRIEMPAEKEIGGRLQTVLTTLYLLFNEGYYSESQDNFLRNDLCMEAMRLTHLLTGNKHTNQPEVAALLALMSFQSSRFAARKNAHGEMVLYEHQDTSRWDEELISTGMYYLHQSAKGNALSKYHLEAAIAYWYTVKEDTAERWEHILQLFNQLLMVAYSPVAALNRTYALSKVMGNEIAIEAAEKLAPTGNHFHYTLLGELYKDTDPGKARDNLGRALELAKTLTDKQLIQDKINKL